MTTLLTSLNRLRRAGAEDGATARKLIDAANEVAAAIVASPVGPLPQGYRILSTTAGEVLSLLTAGNIYCYCAEGDDVKTTYSCASIPKTTLNGARMLADDIAVGEFDHILPRTDGKKGK